MNQPLSEYLKNKEIRNSLRYIHNPVTGERGFKVQPGILISHETIYNMYPMAEGKLKLWNDNHKGDNPDKTWIG